MDGKERVLLMWEEFTQYETYLYTVKHASRNTVAAYMRDLKKLNIYMDEHQIATVKMVNNTNLNSYVLYLERTGSAASSVSRSVASIKSFFLYMLRQGMIHQDPSELLKPPHIDKKLPETLTVEEIHRLLNQPSGDSPKEIRDKAMLELLYATGLRVSELVALRVSDLNLEVGCVICRNGSRERVIPFGQEAKRALERYLEKARPTFCYVQEILFTNCQGAPLTRQGLWKILKSYASKAGIDKDITPNMIRHSFAVHMMENGADLKSLQTLMGHADASTTQVYMKKEQKGIKEVYDRTHPLA